MSSSDDDGEKRGRTEILVARGADELFADRRLRRVAHGIAHGMNNVLATIMGLASVLEGELGPESPMTDDMRAILAASRRGLELTRDLVRLAHGSRGDVGPVPLNDLVASVASFLRPSFPKDLAVRTDLASEPSLVAGDSVGLRHAIIGLALAAADALPSGALRLATSDVVVEGDGSEIRPGAYVRLRIENSLAEGAPHVEPPRLAEAVEAAGLGAARIAELARALGGRLETDARGFTLDLPAIYPEHVSSTPPDPESRVAGQRVLVVDDDALVLRSSERLLRRLGLDVVVARTGEEALALYEPAGISFVLLDLVMPGMDGRAVLEHLLRAHPGARVVISTGYGTEPIQELLEAGAVASIQKPYTLKQLRALIARLGRA